MAWYWILLIIVAGVLLLYLLFCVIVSKKMTGLMLRPSGDRQHSHEWTRAQQSGEFGVDYGWFDAAEREPVEVISRDGTVIKGEFIPAKEIQDSKPKCVIVAHGYTQNRMLSVKFAQIYYDRGYAVLVFDQRCFGDSGGELCTLGYEEKHDIAALIHWTKKRLGADTLIGLHGESLGAIAALEALAIEDGIGFVVEDCASSDLTEYLKLSVKRLLHLPSFPILQLVGAGIAKTGFRFEYVSPRRRVAETDVPILFIHGRLDGDVPCAMCEEMAAAAKNPLSTMFIAQEAGHARSFDVDRDTYTRAVAGFVQKVEQTEK